MSYLAKRSAACQAIKRLHASIIRDVMDWDLIRVYLERKSLESQHERFLAAHDESLADIGDDDIGAHDELLQAVDLQYIEAAAALERRATAKQVLVPAEATPAIASPSSRLEMKLDPVQIPTFDGSLHNWLAFKEAFESLVHSNAELPVAYKLQKLRTAVLPIHVGMVGNIYSGGYEELWAELTERFDNPKLLAETHVSRLLNLRPAADDSPKSILDLVDSVQESMRALRVMGLPVQHWDAIVVPIITARLPLKTRQAWRMACEPKEIPTLAALLSFLQLRAHSLETEIVVPTTTGMAPTSTVQRRNRPMGVTRTHLALDGIQCLFCQRSHRTTTCPQFKDMDIRKRLNAVRDANACFTCLKTGHSAGHCPSTRNCGNCDQRHNTLLCYSEKKLGRPRRRGSTSKPKPDYRNHMPPDVAEEEEQWDV